MRGERSHELAIDHGQVDQCCGHTGMLRSKVFFSDLQRQLIERCSLFQLPLYITYTLIKIVYEQFHGGHTVFSYYISVNRNWGLTLRL